MPEKMEKFEMKYVRLGLWCEICEQLSACPYNASYRVKRNYLSDSKRERDFLKSLGLDLVYWSTGHGWRLRKDWAEKLAQLTELKRQQYRPLREVVDHACRPQGHFGISAYHRPDLSEEELDALDDWYTIGLPYALIVYRLEDIPEEEHYSHSDLFTIKKPAAHIRLKTEEQRFMEEDAARRRGEATV